MLKGSFTALITPFTRDAIDEPGLDQLIDFQIVNGITGILGVGTTGESPTLSWEEHNKVVETVTKRTKGKTKCIAGTGSNNTKEAMIASTHAAEIGVDAVLLVDPYYNGPSSLEIRKEYIEPVAKACPGTGVIPYVIPGRTGTQLYPQDLAILYETCKNVHTVKEATGDIENMRKTRQCCGPEYTILSGDDGMTHTMMTDPQIKAAGVISVASNIAPKAISQLVDLFNQGHTEKAEILLKAVEPLFELVTVKTVEQTAYGEVVCRARNPLGIKTLMAILGMPSGVCRAPVGKMTRLGIEKVLAIGRKVWENNPEILKPAAEFFKIDIEDRLNDPKYMQGLFYDSY